MREIQLTYGKIALVDDEDYKRVNQYKWSINRGYAQARVNGGTVLMHRFILGAKSDNCDIDHINGNRSDNRHENLRLATRTQNNANSKKRLNTLSKYKGVTRHRNKWQVYVNGEYIGKYDDEREAAETYDRIAVRIWGEYARTNF